MLKESIESGQLYDVKFQTFLKLNLDLKTNLVLRRAFKKEDFLKPKISESNLYSSKFPHPYSYPTQTRVLIQDEHLGHVPLATVVAAAPVNANHLAGECVANGAAVHRCHRLQFLRGVAQIQFRMEGLDGVPLAGPAQRTGRCTPGARHAA